MPRIEDRKPLKINWLAIIVSLLLIFLIAGTIQTFTSFNRRAEQIRVDLQDMQDRIDAITEEVRGMKP
jgi:uncharacterized protein YoxC